MYFSIVDWFYIKGEWELFFLFLRWWYCFCIELFGSGSDEDEDDSLGLSRKKGSFFKVIYYFWLVFVMK